MNAAQLTNLERSPDRVRAPLAWLMADSSRVAFGACHRCTHGADEGIERVCTHPALADWAGAPQPVAIPRAWGGGCGPDALRLCDPSIS
jgi:hypothetical protein